MYTYYSKADICPIFQYFFAFFSEMFLLFLRCDVIALCQVTILQVLSYSHTIYSSRAGQIPAHVHHIGMYICVCHVPDVLLCFKCLRIHALK